MLFLPFDIWIASTVYYLLKIHFPTDLQPNLHKMLQIFMRQLANLVDSIKPEYVQEGPQVQPQVPPQVQKKEEVMEEGEISEF